MTDLTVIILAGNEERHIGRCLDMLSPLEARQIFVVESCKGDKTHEIAVERGAETVWHDWPGNQAKQFNWAIDNLSIESSWVLRIDADEWLTEELIDEIKLRLPTLGETVDGVILKRRHYFCGKWVKHGMYPVRILRLFRVCRARYRDDAIMDERLLVEGEVVEFKHDFVDESLISFAEWQVKHRAYAKREAEQALQGAFGDPRKVTYYRLPPYVRAFIYFGVRFILRGGILDGRAGWRWHIWQGLWYRCLVDREMSLLTKRKCFDFRTTGDEKCVKG